SGGIGISTRRTTDRSPTVATSRTSDVAVSRIRSVGMPASATSASVARSPGSTARLANDVYPPFPRVRRPTRPAALIRKRRVLALLRCVTRLLGILTDSVCHVKRRVTAKHCGCRFFPKGPPLHRQWAFHHHRRRQTQNPRWP